jgi:hypothetical protein
MCRAVGNSRADGHVQEGLFAAVAVPRHGRKCTWRSRKKLSAAPNMQTCRLSSDPLFFLYFLEQETLVSSYNHLFLLLIFDLTVCFFCHV